MSWMKREKQSNGLDLAREAGFAGGMSTRRSWLAGVGALFAANAVSSAGVSRAGPTGESEPRSPWPYETPGVRFVLEARVTIGPVIDIGETSYGQRRIIRITGGTFLGPRLAGTVLDQGEDTQLVRPDGVTELAARYTLRTREGTLIYVTNCGLIVPGRDGGGPAHSAPPVPQYVRTIPKLEAPRGGEYEWLNQALYVGTLNPLPPAQHAVVVRFFEVT
jgi:Protein of unknown function (DUF3237)